MSIKNKYVRRAKISESKFRKLIKLFSLDLDAQTIAALINLNRNTVNRYLTLIRKRIAELCEDKSPLNGKFEVDESYFYDKLLGGKGDRDTNKKTPVFGIVKRDGKIYTEIIPDCAKSMLVGIKRGRVDPNRVIRFNGECVYDGLVDFGHKKHYRLRRGGGHELATRNCHINVVASFWSFTKRRLMKFHGIGASTFYLHLKECEFRFNYRDHNIYQILLKMFRENPLF
jgi:transposase-like protein